MEKKMRFKIVCGIALPLILLFACAEKEQISSTNPVNWQKRTLDYSLPDSLMSGTSYLSVYSEIYHQSEERTQDLTVTVSMRNMNQKDTVFIHKAEYFDTQGKSIRSYFDKTIYLAPMETVEIVIDAADETGGTGANFIFDWSLSPEADEPLFEAVMISTSGKQGLSFVTQGKRLKKKSL
jgi:hypothetical protein